MLARRHFLLALALAPLCGYAAPALLSEDEVEVTFDNDLYTGHFSLTVPVTPSVAWEVLTDFGHMAGFVPNLESSAVLEHEGNIVIIGQRGKIDFGPFSFRFESKRRVEMNRKEGTLLSRAISGSTKRMESLMRIEGDTGGSRLDYRLEMVPDRWIPSSLGVSSLRHELAEQFSAIGEEMIRRHRKGKAPESQK